MLTLVNPTFTIDTPHKKKKRETAPAKGLENKYSRSLETVAEEVERIIKRNLKKLTPQAVNKTIRELTKYSGKLFDWSKWISSTIIYAANNDSEKVCSNISRTMSYELKRKINKAPVGTLMKQYLDDQVKLITSMPLTAAQKVHDLLLGKQLIEGKRATTLEEEIMRIGNITRNRARLIARTETSKITTGLTMARAKAIGVDWYIWRTSEDIRVRSSHKVMQDVLVSWGDPPSPEKLEGKKSYGTYHAGSTFNCRCYPEPVVDLEDIKFPAKVYKNGVITRMARAKFLSIAGGIVENNKYAH